MRLMFVCIWFVCTSSKVEVRGHPLVLNLLPYVRQVFLVEYARLDDLRVILLSASPLVGVQACISTFCVLGVQALGQT